MSDEQKDIFAIIGECFYKARIASLAGQADTAKSERDKALALMIEYQRKFDRKNI